MTFREWMGVVDGINNCKSKSLILTGNLIYRLNHWFLMQLFILRHGEAGKRIQAGSKDSERALTVSGEDEVKEITQAFVEIGIELDFIATSPLKRAKQTADIVAKELKLKKSSYEEWDELKPEGKKLELYKRLSQFKAESSVLIVGHEPYLSSLIGEVTFGNDSGSIMLRKAGLAKLNIVSFQP